MPFPLWREPCRREGASSGLTPSELPASALSHAAFETDVGGTPLFFRQSDRGCPRSCDGSRNHVVRSKEDQIAHRRPVAQARQSKQQRDSRCLLNRKRPRPTHEQRCAHRTASRSPGERTPVDLFSPAETLGLPFLSSARLPGSEGASAKCPLLTARPR